MVRFNREFLSALLESADCWLPTRYETPEFLDRVLWDKGQAFHLTLERANRTAKVVLTAVSYEHVRNLY